MLCCNTNEQTKRKSKPMEKILITGANGFLGQHLTLNLTNTGFLVVATGRGDSRLPKGNFEYQSLELTNKAAVGDLLSSHSEERE